MSMLVVAAALIGIRRAADRRCALATASRRAGHRRPRRRRGGPRRGRALPGGDAVPTDHDGADGDIGQQPGYVGPGFDRCFDHRGDDDGAVPRCRRRQ